MNSVGWSHQYLLSFAGFSASGFIGIVYQICQFQRSAPFLFLNFRNDIYRWESFEMLFHPSTWPCFLGKSRLPPYTRKKFDSGADDRLLKYLSPLIKFSFSVSPDLISTAHSWAPASRIKSISWPVLFRQKKALERRPAWSLDLMCSDVIKDSNIFPRR